MNAMNVQSQFYTIPSTPKTKNQVVRSKREPFELPEVGSDPLQAYVTAVVHTSPIYSFCIGGINFDRFVLPSEASLQGNEGKYYAPKYVVRMFTKAQVEAIKKRAAELVLIVPKRQNPKFTDKQGKEKEYLDGYEIKASEIMILEPVEKFNPMTSSIPRVEEEKPQMDNLETLKEELYKQQAQRKK